MYLLATTPIIFAAPPSNVDNVCCKILNLFFDNENDVQDHQGWYSGEYNVQNDRLINYKEYYVSSNGEKAIWYFNGKWIVNVISNLGTLHPSLISTDGPTCPGDTQSWTYNADGTLKDGSDYIHFSCRE